MSSDGANIFIVLSGMNEGNDKDKEQEHREEARREVEHKRLIRMLESINASVKDSGDRTSPSPS
jgi:hypothetical protein